MRGPLIESVTAPTSVFAGLRRQCANCNAPQHILVQQQLVGVPRALPLLVVRNQSRRLLAATLIRAPLLLSRPHGPAPTHRLRADSRFTIVGDS